MQKQLSTILFGSLFFVYSFQINAAVKIVECEDADGNHSFQKTCPPGYTLVSEKKISTGKSDSDKGGTNNQNLQATLYMVPECESCDDVRDFLSAKKVAVTEKNVKDDLKLQNELTEAIGTLEVPTTIIGKEKIKGYKRSSLLEALKSVGYTEEEEEAL